MVDMVTRKYSDELVVAANQNRVERDYWLKKLEGQWEITCFPIQSEAVPGIEAETVIATIPFPAPLCSNALKLSKNSFQTLNVVLLTGLMILLEKYTGVGDIIIGTPIYKQEQADHLLNTVLPLRTHIDEDMTFKQCLMAVKQTVTEANKHLNYPYEVLRRQLSDPNATEPRRLFDTAALLENIHDIDYLAGTGSSMVFVFRSRDNQIECDIRYNSAMYSDVAVQGIGRHLITLLDNALTNLDIEIRGLPMMPQDEQEQLLVHFNDTGEPYPNDKTLVQLFETVVNTSPGNTAVTAVTEDITSSLNYDELNEKSGGLARNLIKMGAKPGDLVGLLAVRSLEMIIGILGILKAGCGYVPLNPNAPATRNGFMLNQCRSTLLVTTGDCYGDGEKISEWNGDLCFIETIDDSSDEVLLESVAPDSIAYVIFTSGSTGQPKGVPINHRNLSPLLHWGYRHLGLDGNDRSLQNLSYYFDWSVWEIFITLTTGGCLYMVPDDILLNPADCAQFIVDNNVTVLHVTPTQYSYLTGMGQEFTTLKYLFLGAEKLTLDLVKRSFQSVGAHCRVFNMYGPTEATIISAVQEITPDKLTNYEDLTSIPIGVPTGNTKLYILDKRNNPCPIFITGELYITGDGVAQGYLNRPEQTSEVFLKQMGNLQPGNTHRQPHPSHPSYLSHRSYKTGDLARWLPDGTIEYLGRVDFQVKIRGFRIELGEIENRLLGHRQVKEAFVLAHAGEDGETYLCAYIIPEDGSALSGAGQVGEAVTRDFQEHLLQFLPEYMVPAYYIVIDKVPLNPNGKLDRNALPMPGFVASEYVPPADEMETKLVYIWSEVLSKPVEEIGVTNDFFEMGGHSLKATILTAKIHKVFNVKIPLAQVFDAPTIREQAKIINVGAFDLFTALTPAEAKEYYRLSSAQTRIYILQQMEPHSTTYNMPQSAHLDTDVDFRRVDRAYRVLIDMHECLRTSFHMVNEQPVQLIREHDRVDFAIEYHGFGVDPFGGIPALADNGIPLRGDGHCPVDGLSQDQMNQLRREFVRPFDLSNAPLLRVGIINLGKNGYLMMIDTHHIISDGISNDILTRNFRSLYSMIPVPPLKLQYKDYAEWQWKEMVQGVLKKQEAYWMEVFPQGESVPVLSLPTDFPRPAVQSFDGESVTYIVDKQKTAGLKELGTTRDATLYMVLLSFFNILLSKLSRQEDIIVGTPVAGRSHADLQPIIGMFVNTLAIRNLPTGNLTYSEFLSQVKTRTLGAFENQDYQFEDLVDRVTVNRDTGRNPMFDVMFSFQNIGTDDPRGMRQPTSPAEGNDSGGLVLKSNGKTVAKFDITMVASERDERLHLDIDYCARLFKPGTIEMYIRYLDRIIEAVTGNADIQLFEIDILSSEEKRQLLVDFNHTGEPYPVDKTIMDLFSRQVVRSPESTAVVSGTNGVSLTYRELDDISGAVAGYLIQKGAVPGSVVGILVDRSIRMITGILGILKAGCAYVPLNPKAPAVRSVYMLEECRASILLTTHPLMEAAVSEGEADAYHLWHGETLYINDAVESGLRHCETVSPDSPAYVIFTSGSTGKPKGVVINHSNLSPLLHWGYRDLGLDSGDRTIQNLSYYFDWSVWEIFITLTSGATLVMVPDEILLNPDECVHFIQQNSITVLHVTPSQYSYLVNVGQRLETLKYLFIGAEKLTAHITARSLRSVNDSCRVFNMYGPTEATIISAVLEIRKQDLETYYNLTSVPIGKPVGNTNLYIRDKYDRPVPVRVAGELYISGDGVSRGYLNRPDLTAEVFLSHRSYRTGDLARWLPDGTVEFLGRIDFQVKIRGFRIELGEIEAQLLAMESVKEAVVIARQAPGGTGEDYLCAYVVKDGEVDASGLRDILATQLPDYMIPSYFIFIDNIPLNPNGKVDLNALPEPEITTRARYIAPRNAVEKKLVEIWTDVLEMVHTVQSADQDEETGEAEPRRIGITDNFFELGGHSLRATVMVSKIKKELGVNVPLIEVFRSPTIEKLSGYIKSVDHTKEAVSTGETDNLVLLSERFDNAPNVFFIHDGSGEVEGYMQFCRQLREPVNCWGIRAGHFPDLSPRNISVEDLAALHIKAIKNLQPEGPYRLVGWSLGGVFVYEMARQLESIGETVAFLGLIDAMPPYDDGQLPVTADLPFALIDQKGKSRGEAAFSPASERLWLSTLMRDEEIVRHLEKMSTLSSFWEEAADYLEKKEVEGSFSRTALPQYMMQTIPHADRLQLRKLIQQVNVLRSLRRAHALYQTNGKIRTRLHYFAASQSKEIIPLHQWNQYTEHPIEPHQLQGNHFSILRLPSVIEFARLFENLVR